MRKYNFFKLITIELCRFHYILTTTIEALALAFFLVKMVEMVEKGFGISVSVGFGVFFSKDGREGLWHWR